MRYYELRIVMPVSLNEFKVGHVYSRYKLRQRETSSTKTETQQCSLYDDDSSLLGKGIYTHHAHQVLDFLPSWVTTMIGGSRFIVHGRTWDSYPYISSSYELPSMANATVRIDSIHIDNDIGLQHNVFNLSKDILSTRQVIYLDIARDQENMISSPDEEPYKFKYTSEYSHVPSRGPLSPDWIDELQTKSATATATPPPHMCVYILLGINIELAISSLRNHAYELAQVHFTRAMIDLHRLSYIWIKDWAQYVDTTSEQQQQKSIHPLSPLLPGPVDETIQQQRYSQYSELLSLVMKDAKSNSTIIPPRPEPLLISLEEAQNRLENTARMNMSTNGTNTKPGAPKRRFLGRLAGGISTHQARARL